MQDRMYSRIIQSAQQILNKCETSWFEKNHDTGQPTLRKSSDKLKVVQGWVTHFLVYPNFSKGLADLYPGFNPKHRAPRRTSS
jgi:hypothetical protein